MKFIFKQENYAPYDVKEEKNKVVVNVYNKDSKTTRFKLIIPKSIMLEKYKGYKKPTNVYAFDIDNNSIVRSPDTVGYTGHDSIFEITDIDSEEIMRARLFKQWEWDFFSSKKFLKNDISMVNYQFFLDIQTLYNSS